MNASRTNTSRTTTSRTTTTALLTAGIVLLLLLATAVTPSTASASVSDDGLPEIGEVFAPDQMGAADTCAEDWCYRTGRHAAPDDAGGWVAHSMAYLATDFGRHYSVVFQPRDEILHLNDHFKDGHRARGEVVVVAPYTGVVLDRDTLWSSYEEDFQLGTPDGSGDIVEGLWVYVRVCRGDTSLCSPWSRGVA